MGETTGRARSEVAPSGRSHTRRAVTAASIGNALEWYDIIIYGYFAAVISRLFFPGGSDFEALMLTFGTFAVSYLIRPVGALVIGSLGDTRGRKLALNLTILLMFTGTLLLTVAPTHQQIGAAGAAIVLLARLLQGFSAGGEFGSATTFLTEHALERKAFYASWQTATQGAALLLAASVSLIVTATLSDVQLDSWGWRLAFAIGLLIGPVGFYIRTTMDDPAEFKAVEVLRSPIGELLKSHVVRVCTAAGCVGFATVTMYLLIYLPTYAVKHLDLPLYSGYLGGIIGGALLLACSPAIGALADRRGCVAVMRIAAGLGVLTVVPIFLLVTQQPSVWMLTVAQAVLGVVLAFYFAPLPALMSSLFPTQIRTSGVSTSYNLGVVLFGGTAPLVFTALVEVTDSLVAPASFVTAVAAISWCAVGVARSRFGQR
ncbi:MFS transporter [Jiangella endophytica]|uniref:MFS transporter n=1 Tax=Jiangella endophytica TaxID=1623398 RepID=UPI000E354877|nr:MFS transporter [Jiangella endophytica]